MQKVSFLGFCSQVNKSAIQVVEGTSQAIGVAAEVAVAPDGTGGDVCVEHAVLGRVVDVDGEVVGVEDFLFGDFLVPDLLDGGMFWLKIRCSVGTMRLSFRTRRRFRGRSTNWSSVAGRKR